MENEEADALTNLDFRHFDAAKRVQVDLKELKFGLLPLLIEFGEGYDGELQTVRKAEKERALAAAEKGVQKKKRKKAGDSLREKDPW